MTDTLDRRCEQRPPSQTRSADWAAHERAALERSLAWLESHAEPVADPHAQPEPPPTPPPGLLRRFAKALK